MKFTHSTLASGAWVLAAQPEDYDAWPPLMEVRFDAAPKTLHPERAAVGAYLLFRPWISGAIQAGPWISPAVAKAIQEHAAPVWMGTVALSLYARAIAKGDREARIELGGVGHPAPSEDWVMSFPRSDRSFGSVWGEYSFVNPSNAWLLADEGASAERRAEVALGCATLFAEDLGVVAFDWTMSSKSTLALLKSVGITCRS